MMYTDEIAAVKIAVKRAKKAGDIEVGFQSLFKWHTKHQTRDINWIIKCYKKAIKQGIV